jgi:polysaccharide biosynthesis/export protein
LISRNRCLYALLLVVCLATLVQAQASPVGSVSSTPFVPQVVPLNMQSPAMSGQSGVPQSLTPAQADMARRLSPEQRSAVEAELGRSGGVLTSQGIEALRARPEFRGLSNDDIARGRDLLERGDRGIDRRELSSRPDRRLIVDDKEPTSLFQRYRTTRKFQDIPMELKPFGYEFFKEAAVKMAAERQDIPVPGEYVVGPGDEVKILLWGRVNAQYNLLIDRNGNITVPQIGPIRVAGMTFEQMAKHLVGQSEQIVGANIDVTMGALKSIPIFVLGDVRRPGAYTIGSFATITDALLMAGGPSEVGSMRTVQLRRNDKVVSELDLYDLLLKGDKSKDKALQAGDVVFLGVAGPLVGVAGNVRRPAIYELKQRLDLQSFFDLAGGIIPTADTQRIQVERIVKNDRQIVIDINDRNLDAAKNIQLQDGDLVKVFPIVEKDVNAVYLFGNVKRPGKYELKPGMKVTDLIKDPNDLLEETHLEYALVKRLVLPTAEPILIPLNLKRLLFDKDASQNIRLEPQDSVFIFSKWFFRDRPFVTIEGEVRRLAFRAAKEERKGPARQTYDDTLSDIFGQAKLEEKMQELRSDRLDQLSVRRDGLADRLLEMRPDDRDKLLKEMKVEDRDAILRQLKPEERDIVLNQFRPEERDMILRRLRQDERDLALRQLKQEGRGGMPREGQSAADLERTGKPLLTESAQPDVTPVRYIRVDLIESMRVRDAILAAGGLTREAYLERAEIVRLDDRQEFKRVYFNLAGALDGDPQHNIVLQDQDRVIVHSSLGYAYRRTVAVEGAVVKPGSYQYSNSMTVRDLVFAAGNITESAFLDEAELSSQFLDNGRTFKVDHRKINLRKVLEGDPAHNLPLKPYDRLFVKQIPDWSREQFVTVSGEVRFPGRYILRKGERLSSVVDRAGGYGENAYLRGAYFTRESVRELQEKALTEMVARLERELLAEGSMQASASLSQEEVAAKRVEMEQKQKFIEALRKVKAMGRMTIFLTNVRLLKGSPYDIELQAGDSLFVPTSTSVVNVVGSVMSFGSFVYLDKADYNLYIQMAGGYSRYADTDNAYVLKVDGSARKLSKGTINWNPFNNRYEFSAFVPDEKPIEPGDTIVVPEKLDRIAWLRQIKDITQILANVALAAGVIIAAGN